MAAGSARGSCAPNRCHSRIRSRIGGNDWAWSTRHQGHGLHWKSVPADQIDSDCARDSKRRRSSSPAGLESARQPRSGFVPPAPIGHCRWRIPRLLADGNLRRAPDRVLVSAENAKAADPASIARRDLTAYALPLRTGRAPSPPTDAQLEPLREPTSVSIGFDCRLRFTCVLWNKSHTSRPRLRYAEMLGELQALALIIGA